jgi:hypothetical protein
MHEVPLNDFKFGVCYVSSVTNNYSHLLVGHIRSERYIGQKLAQCFETLRN